MPGMRKGGGALPLLATPLELRQSRPPHKRLFIPEQGSHPNPPVCKMKRCQARGYGGHLFEESWRQRQGQEGQPGLCESLLLVAWRRPPGFALACPALCGCALVGTLPFPLGPPQRDHFACLRREHACPDGGPQPSPGQSQPSLPTTRLAGRGTRGRRDNTACQHLVSGSNL